MGVSCSGLGIIRHVRSATVLLAALCACGTRAHFVSTMLPSSTGTDPLVIQAALTETGVDLNIQNTGPVPVTVIWNQSSIIDGEGHVWQVGTPIENDEEGDEERPDAGNLPAVTIPPHATLRTTVQGQQVSNNRSRRLTHVFPRECGPVRCTGPDLTGTTITVALTVAPQGGALQTLMLPLRIDAQKTSWHGARPRGSEWH